MPDQWSQRVLLLHFAMYGEIAGARASNIFYIIVVQLCWTHPTEQSAAFPLLLTNERYRAHVVKHVTDLAVRNFWEEEFHSCNERFRTEAIAPVLNKVGKLLHTPAIRNIFCQASSTIDLRFMIDNKRILITNLAKGVIGEDAANLIGSFLGCEPNSNY